MAVSMIGPKFYAWDNNGKPLAYGKLYTYQAGTSNNKPTFTGEESGVENTNPVILNDEGYAEVYLEGSYRMILKDADDNDIWSADPVSDNASEEWKACEVATYVSTNTLRISGNFLEDYTPGRRVRIDNDVANYSYATIVSSGYGGGLTTITIGDNVIEASVKGICASIVGAEATPSGFSVGLSVQFMMENTGVYPDSVITSEFYTGTRFGGGTWVKNGASGYPGASDFANGTFNDGSGIQRVLVDKTVTPAMLGAKANGTDDDVQAIKDMIDFSNDCVFDRFYYVGSTVTLPSSISGKNLRGLSRKETGIKTLTGFSGEEQEIVSAINEGPSISLKYTVKITTAAAHGLSYGDSIVIYGSDDDTVNGLHTFISPQTDTTFEIRVTSFPVTPTTIGGDMKFFSANPVIKISETGSYSDFKISNFLIDGDGGDGTTSYDTEKACGNALQLYLKQVSADAPQLLGVSVDNVTLKAYGGSGLYAENTESCSFSNITASSVLHDSFFVKGNTSNGGRICSEFKNLYSVNAGPGHACFRGDDGAHLTGFNCGGKDNAASYGLYFGDNAEVNIDRCVLDGTFLHHIVFSDKPNGSIKNTRFNLNDDNTESFIYISYASTSGDKILTLSSNEYEKDGYDLSIYDFVLVDGDADKWPFIDLGAGMGVGSDESAVPRYFVLGGVNSGNYYNILSLTYGYIPDSIIEVGNDEEISVGGIKRILVKSSTAGTVKTLTGAVDGDELEITFADENTTIQHDWIASTPNTICTSSMNNFTGIPGLSYRFKYRGDTLRWHQFNNTHEEMEALSINASPEKQLITRQIPAERAVYSVSVYTDSGNIKADLTCNGGDTISDSIIRININDSTDLNLFVENIAVDGGSASPVIRIHNVGGAVQAYKYAISRVQ